MRAAGQLTCPERRRRTVESVRRTLGQEKVSERRVCRVLGQNRGTQRHRPRKVAGDRELLGMMRKIVETFPRHGSERTHRVLTGPEAFGGWKVNFKRVHRIWKEEHMQMPQKQRKRRRLPGGPPTDWGQLVQLHDDRDVLQAALAELPSIDIHSL